MLKFAENPPLLYPHESTVRQMAGRWWVAHTKARAEKAFAWDLLNNDIAYFLPMIERITISGGRKRRGMMPLFTSYVFFCGSQDQRLDALLTQRLCQVIEVTDQAQLIEELSTLEHAINGRATFNPYPFAAVGRRCRVTRGPFEGIAGTVIQRDGEANPRLVLQVSLLGQGAAMEIDADLLEPVE